MFDIDQRAKALDDARRIRILKSQDIDVDKYSIPQGVETKVKEASEFLDEIQEDFINPPENLVCTMPWVKTWATFNFRPGEVTVYAGGNGGGKSLITGQVALGLLKQSHRVCIASFEMKPKRTLLRMLRQFGGIDLEGQSQSVVESLINRFKGFAQSNLWMYDQQGTTSPRTVIAMARYCAMELAVTHIFIDSLMKCVMNEDDYNEQKKFVDELTSVARDCQVHIHLVHHIRKLASEESTPNKNDIKGSGSISDQVDNVLMMFRNKKKEHDQNADPSIPDAMLMCEKQRNGESEEWYSLWYHKPSQQFVEAHDAIPMSFDDVGDF